jgi:YHS domain-containing protein
MDAEAIKSLVSILLWGGLFFFMMRFGCGAHMMGGHGRHRGHGNTDGETKDPVCGITVDREKSTAASAYRGTTYHFCSASCRDKFEQAPEEYTGAPAQGDQYPGGHHHA